MSISTDYRTPVQVNGFSCRNCTDVANAKKGVDPEHPEAGPYGVNADRTRADSYGHPSAVALGGSLADLALSANVGEHAAATRSIGCTVDICC